MPFSICWSTDRAAQRNGTDNGRTFAFTARGRLSVAGESDLLCRDAFDGATVATTAAFLAPHPVLTFSQILYVARTMHGRNMRVFYAFARQLLSRSSGSSWCAGSRQLAGSRGFEASVKGRRLRSGFLPKLSSKLLWSVPGLARLVSPLPTVGRKHTRIRWT